MTLPTDDFTPETPAEWAARQKVAEKRTDRLMVFALGLGCFLLGALGVGFVLVVRALLQRVLP